MAAMISLTDVTKSYVRGTHRVDVLQGLNLEIRFPLEKGQLIDAEARAAA